MSSTNNPQTVHGPVDHCVRLYSDDAILARHVGEYLASGLRQGDGGLVIATPDHSNAFQEHLASHGIDLLAAERTGRLLFLDARQTLAKFIVRGRPEWDRFETTISAAVASLAPDAGAQICAYGEMVGVLWTEGSYSAAIELEEHWNRVLASLNARLLCSYPIDIFGREFEASAVHAILCDHSRLLASDDSGQLERALDRALRKVLGEGPLAGSDARLARPSQWGDVPPAEDTILWVRKNLPHRADDIFRQARRYYSERTRPV